MLSPEVNQLVIRERHQDRLRRAEHKRRVQALAQPNTSLPPQEHKMVHQLGSLMIRWGTKLQSL